MRERVAKRSGESSRFARATCGLLFALGCLTIAGCNGGLATAGGTVTVDGKPVEGSPDLYGTVSFYRDGGGGAPAIGIIKSGGKYNVATGSQAGIEPGKYVVGVAVKKILPPATPDGLTSAQQLTPAKYAKPMESGFTAEVKPGSNTFDFALKSE